MMCCRLLELPLLRRLSDPRCNDTHLYFCFVFYGVIIICKEAGCEHDF